MTQKPPSGTHIRLRLTFGGWEWNLVTEDRHVAAASPRYGSYEECEADAKKQGLPVFGKTWRAKKQAPPAIQDTELSRWRFPYDESAGFWQWERLNDGRKIVEESGRAFLTKDECVADARKHGYLPRKGP